MADQTLKAPALNPMGQDPLGSLPAHLVHTLQAQQELGDHTLASTGANSLQHTTCLEGREQSPLAPKPAQTATVNFNSGSNVAYVQ